MRRSFLLSLIVTLILSQIAFFTPTQAETVEPTLSVKLVNYLGNRSEITVTPTDVYAVENSTLKLERNVSYTVKVADGGVSLLQEGQLLGSFTSLDVIPTKYSAPLLINGRKYLGSVSFTNEGGKYVRPINTLPMEDYVKGVVPNEMPNYWNLEALKVQAVAARTYAMSYVNKVINDTISYQVYGGYTWYERSTQAVNETFGQVVTYQGSLISAVFSASNGGRTESNANAWGSTALPYFKIKDDPYDHAKVWTVSVQKQQLDLVGKDLTNPDFWWSTVSEADAGISNNIKLWMLANGYAGKEIKIVGIPTMKLYNPSSGGRVTKGDITVQYIVKDELDEEGKIKVQTLSFTNVNASRIRAMIGNRAILSYLVTEAAETTSAITIQGKGDGHGVGMSQYGAKAMGEAGKSYRDILAFYYEGTTLSSKYQVSAPKEEAAVDLPAKGTLDEPTEGAAVRGTATVRGWFLDGSGVSKVEVLVDGTVQGLAQYGVSRPDVQRVYPAYENGNAGYTYQLDTTKLSDGKHTVAVRMTDNNDEVTVLQEKAIYVSNPVLTTRGMLDEPTEGAAVRGTATVRGWFLDGSGVAKIEVLVDEAVKGTAVYGGARPDVQRVYPAYNNGNAGYKYQLDTTKLSNGKHSITVRATSKNGQVTVLPPQTVTVFNQTLEAKGVIDAPTANAKVSGTQTVRGWFLDSSGVAKVEVVVDGSVRGTAVYGSSRPDVQRVYPAYNNGHAGYTYQLDTRKLSNGSHTVTVRATGKNGQITTLPAQTIHVYNQVLPARGSLDEPTAGSVLKGVQVVRGWFLDGSGVAKIEVVVDGSVRGTAVYGSSRPDVQRVYPAYNNGHAGYTYQLDTTKLSNGSHTILVRMTNKSGQVTALPERTITVAN